MGTVLVARGDEILLNKGYGQANVEWNIPNTPATKFRLGSLTKQFTAASILLLEERGKLAIEDPLSKHMADVPAAWSAITLHHLLTHTSGIPNVTSLPEFATYQPFATTVEKTIALVRDKPLDFAPGDRMSYSNSGYLVLSHLVERISGQSYETFLTANILDPLGMKDTGLDSNATIIPRRAAGYTSSATGLVNAGFVHMSVPHGAGAMYSTTEDLLRWERGLFGGKVVSAASLRKMTTPFKNNYAFGVVGRHVERQDPHRPRRRHPGIQHGALVRSGRAHRGRGPRERERSRGRQPGVDVDVRRARRGGSGDEGRRGRS